MFLQIFRRESGSANKIPSQMAFKRKQPDATLFAHHNPRHRLPVAATACAASPVIKSQK